MTQSKVNNRVVVMLADEDVEFLRQMSDAGRLSTSGAIRYCIEAYRDGTNALEVCNLVCALREAQSEIARLEARLGHKGRRLASLADVIHAHRAVQQQLAAGRDTMPQAEAASHLGVTRWAIQRLVRSGAIETTSKGEVHTLSLLDWLAERIKEGAKPASTRHT